jgi:branched-chain amino acid transport system substrate-binding protein
MSRRNTALLTVFRMVALVAALGLMAASLAACSTPAPAATPEVIKETVVVEQTVVVEATPEPEKEPIRIGMGQPFSGPVAWLGENINMGLTLAAEELNAEGGIQGHRIELYACDNEGQAEKAITCVRKLVDQNNVDMIIGMGSSTCTAAAMPLIEDLQVPFEMAMVSDKALTEGTGRAGGNIWTFRAVSHEGQIGEAFAGYIAEEVNSVNTAFGRYASESMQERLEARGVEVLSVDLAEEGQADYRPTLTRIKSFNPEAVYVALMAKDGAVCVKQMGEVGLTARLFSSELMAYEFFDTLGEDIGLAEGMLEISSYPTGKFPEFEQQFRDRWGGIGPHPCAAGSYNVLRYVVPAAIENALTQCGDLSNTCIRDAFESVSVETPLFGLVEYDEYNQGHPDIALMQVQNGEPVFLEWISTVGY